MNWWCLVAESLLKKRWIIGHFTELIMDASDFAFILILLVHRLKAAGFG